MKFTKFGNLKVTFFKSEVSLMANNKAEANISIKIREIEIIFFFFNRTYTYYKNICLNYIHTSHSNMIPSPLSSNHNLRPEHFKTFPIIKELSQCNKTGNKCPSLDLLNTTN